MKHLILVDATWRFAREMAAVEEEWTSEHGLLEVGAGAFLVLLVVLDIA